VGRHPVTAPTTRRLRRQARLASVVCGGKHKNDSYRTGNGSATQKIQAENRMNPRKTARALFMCGNPAPHRIPESFALRWGIPGVIPDEEQRMPEVSKMTASGGNPDGNMISSRSVIRGRGVFI